MNFIKNVVPLSSKRKRFNPVRENLFTLIVDITFWRNKMTNKEATIELRNILNNLMQVHDFNPHCFVDIVISSRLRCQNGNCKMRWNKTTRKILLVKITMSRALLDEFGWKYFEATFKHEVAHLAETVIYKRRSSHGITFKRLCKLFGGSIRESQAIGEFAGCNTAKFIKRISKDTYSYTCPCGVVVKYSKRMSLKLRNSRVHRCLKCGTPTSMWVERKIEF